MCLRDVMTYPERQSPIRTLLSPSTVVECAQRPILIVSNCLRGITMRLSVNIARMLYDVDGG